MILRCCNLVRTFETAGASTGSATNKGLEVLRGVTLELAPAQVIAILGPSGSGKSTFLHLLGGLDRPTSGEIFWADHNLTKLNQSQLAKLRSEVMGLIFQSHYLLEDLSVLENVSLPGRIKGKLDTARAKDLLAQVGLSERTNAFPKTLSGGERQRVAVARALYSRPQIILADEPTGSLDRHNAKAVYQLLVDLARREGSAVVMVTHDEGLVHDVDKRYHLDEGVLQPVPASTATESKASESVTSKSKASEPVTSKSKASDLEASADGTHHEAANEAVASS